jgi:hypothetical protein
MVKLSAPAMKLSPKRGAKLRMASTGSKSM